MVYVKMVNAEKSILDLGYAYRKTTLFITICQITCLTSSSRVILIETKYK